MTRRFLLALLLGLVAFVAARAYVHSLPLHPAEVCFQTADTAAISALKGIGAHFCR